MTNEKRSTTITFAAIAFVVTGILYAIPTIPLTAFIITERTLPVFLGIPFYSGSFFARQGLSWVIVSNFLFMLVGVVNIAIGLLLWKTRKIGAYLSIATFPVIMAISFGGEAPLALIIEPIKLLLVVFGWPSLLT